ncbi:MAG: type II toxin-antitoxin system HicA family toxin [Gammaproteobacteria bacterium]|uniref:HicA protein n=1 Tax=endosymbiont of Bathymodiolus septemdierum str. Myojin knoll TaxID=1303921 RepID=A0A0P0URS8_9GAMM|nr:type II toxin-antitoxin system HicA family toxin [Bathymodiolus septemdierum thioautotrophic gill symbiont]RUA04535.1 MAG: type II toxin-antitoxin system HicA family toxin [Gammaproteobacteria bacterium]BAS67969.1 HicA protein [endosymbiont of Bathymodiolus septemdierum str. Myojin knoll]
MNNKHRKTLDRLLTKPALKNIKFSDIDNLLIAIGLVRSEGSGSRIVFRFGDAFIVLHKPHPNNEVKTYVIKQLQNFLKDIGVK